MGRLNLWRDNVKQRICLFSFCAMTAAGMSNAHAGDFAVNGVAARAQSMQAFTAVADDPSAVYYNPAGLTQLKGTQVNANLLNIYTHANYTNALNQQSSVATNGALAPSLFIASNADPIYLGFGIYAPFARELDYTITPAVYGLDQNSEIQRIDFVPTVAAKLGKYVSVGVGFVGSRINASTNALGFDEAGRGNGATGQGGILITLPKGIKLGVDYRGPEKGRIEGDGTLTTPFGPISDDFNADFDFPGILSTGISWQVMQQLLLSFDYDYEMWTHLDSITPIYNHNPILTQLAYTTVNGNNSDDFRAGLIFRPNVSNEFRLGAAYVEKAIPEVNIIPCQPDYSAAGGSVGYSRYYRNWRFDAGYEYGDLFDHQGKNLFFPGDYHGHLNTFLFGVNYTLA